MSDSWAYDGPRFLALNLTLFTKKWYRVLAFVRNKAFFSKMAEIEPCFLTSQIQNYEFSPINVLAIPKMFTDFNCLN